MAKIQVTGWSGEHDKAIETIYSEFTTLLAPSFTNRDGSINYSAVIRYALLAEAARIKRMQSQDMDTMRGDEE